MYEHLFKGNQGTNPEDDILSKLDQTKAVLLNQQQLAKSKKRASSFDEMLAKKASKDSLFRLKAMEETLKFFEGRPANKELIEELFELIYAKLNGKTTTRINPNQRVFR